MPEHAAVYDAFPPEKLLPFLRALADLYGLDMQADFPALWEAARMHYDLARMMRHKPADFSGRIELDYAPRPGAGYGPRRARIAAFGAAHWMPPIDPPS